jgi:hypothetical protein
MKLSLVSAVAAGFALIASAALVPAVAGNGHNKPSQQNCAPGKPGCGTCRPGRPGCQTPYGNQYDYYHHQPYNDNYADNHGGPQGAYWFPQHSNRMSCNSAIDRLADHGFLGIKVKDCSGGRYNFTARKNGKRFWISFNARNGRFTRSVL